MRFLERSEPDSTVDGASVDIWNKRVGLMSILLTLFRSNVCWAKPNHAFFYCQHSFANIFQSGVATRRQAATQTGVAGDHQPRIRTGACAVVF
ncbi:hypothetical protein XCCB100_1279 [Xanthomonas campestris pv. campestris]|uniref:Uncharacterized protein n=1 Tax=Xanthomonas campestris pv. campestris (strain B100) TaxID=509169 RepID=B0RQ94_XANCB|nr:hypothetical protein XCCB100_1279 [Xanthomonas campestris pv. campestris]